MHYERHIRNNSHFVGLQICKDVHNNHDNNILWVVYKWLAQFSPTRAENGWLMSITISRQGTRLSEETRRQNNYFDRNIYFTKFFPFTFYRRAHAHTYNIHIFSSRDGKKKNEIYYERKKPPHTIRIPLTGKHWKIVRYINVYNYSTSIITRIS